MKKKKNLTFGGYVEPGPLKYMSPEYLSDVEIYFWNSGGEIFLGVYDGCVCRKCEEEKEKCTCEESSFENKFSYEKYFQLIDRECILDAEGFWEKEEFLPFCDNVCFKLQNNEVIRIFLNKEGCLEIKKI